MNTILRRIYSTPKAKPAVLLGLVVLIFTVASAQAMLFRVGPNDEPSPPGSGYPLWYQDTSGLALDLCIPRNQAQLDAGVCLILPPDQDPAGFTLPIAFPDNFPDEAFWWNASAVMDMTPNSRALLVLALEAAFAGGDVVMGDQISFGRIRVVVDAPVAGTYTVTHPYGVKVFPDVQPGQRAITFTDDIGIGDPGDFTGALESGIGPFLRAADASGNVLSPITVGGDLFLADPATPVRVTGSPISDPDDPLQRANFFRVCVDNPLGLDGEGTRCATVSEFTLMGKVHQGAIGSPLTLDRATYARDASGAHVDVFATAAPGPGAAPPLLYFGDAAGTDLMPSALMNGPTGLGRYYGQSIPDSPEALPAGVIVTNAADDPPSSVRQSLVDEVTITQASYNPDTSILIITATSSDKGLGATSSVLPPQLFAIGLPGSPTGSEALTSTGNAADPAEQEIGYAIPAPPVPPFAVTVISSAGGMGTETVSSTAGGIFSAGGPIAVDDSMSVEAGTTLVEIPVLLNDSGGSPATVRIVTQGSNGTASADAVTGVVTYTFANPLLIGEDSFTYTVRNASGLESNVASVLVTATTPETGPVPVASDDGPFSVQVNAALIIPAGDLTANDTGNGGTLDPDSIEIASQTGGTAVFDAAAGTVTFTAGDQAGGFNFTYTVANTPETGGQRSAPAAAAVTVLPATDELTITEARFRTGNRRWDIGGTSSVPGPWNIVTVTLLHAGSPEIIIGTAAVDATGVWSLRVQNSTALAGTGDQVLAESTANGSAITTVRVTR